MGLVNSIVGTSGMHAVHCEKMQKDYLANYPSTAQFLYVPPTVVSQHLVPANPAAIAQLIHALLIVVLLYVL